MEESSWDRSGRARAVLAEVARDYGPRALSDPQLLRNLLGDKMPDAPREASLLVAAAEAGVPRVLQNRLDHGIPVDVAAREAEATLEERHAYDGRARTWVVGELARALGHPLPEEAVPTAPVAPRPPPEPMPGPEPAPVPASEAAPRGDDRRKAIAAIVATVVVAAGVIAVVFALTRHNNGVTAGQGGTSTPKTAAPTTTVPYLNPFIGDWHAHGVVVTINADGTGTGTWRVYKWCTEDPTPPCDGRNGNEIVNGGHGTFRLTATEGTTATGTVSQTTDPQSLPQGQLIVKILPDNHMSLGNFQTQLCGPASDPNSCGA